MQKQKTVIGVDEAGRGPLAGPVYIGIVAVNREFDFDRFVNLTDSKQMNKKSREAVFNQVTDNNYSGMAYTIRHTTAAFIDEYGIDTAISRAINRGLRHLDAPKNDPRILLDGGLSAPNKYQQETITGGDKKEPIISLASVLAKVARDQYMRKISEQYNFDFAQHKGYGTKKHRRAIQKVGPTDIHRNTFISSIIN